MKIQFSGRIQFMLVLREINLVISDIYNVGSKKWMARKKRLNIRFKHNAEIIHENRAKIVWECYWGKLHIMNSCLATTPMKILMSKKLMK